MSAENKPRLPILALDLGGSKIISAIISPDGEMLARGYFPTQAEQGLGSVMSRIFSAIDYLLEQKRLSLSQLDSISVAAAGVIDMGKGLVTSSPHLPDWHNVPLRDIIAARYKITTFLLNDADAAALGEHRFGAGKGVGNLIYVTVSTGIGGGIIFDGRLYVGSSFSAGEIGHMTIDVNGPKCPCGNTGCWEMLASGTAMAKEAIGRIRQGEKSSLREMVEGKIEKITAEKIALAAQSGDPLALAVINNTAIYFGVGLVNLVNIFSPERIIVGGGVAKIGDLLFEPARRVVKERAFPALAQTVHIMPSQLGDGAGVLGAAVFAWQQGQHEEGSQSK